MMGGNPNWWSNIHSSRSSATVYGDHDHQRSTNDLLTQTTSLFPLQFMHGSSSLPFDPLVSDGHEFPHSWSQLLLGGLASHEEDRLISASSDFQPRKLETWEEHINPISATITAADHLKKEARRQSNNSSLYCCHEEEEEEEIAAAKTRPPAWPQIFPASSPKSCVTSLSSNILDFSNNGSGGHEWNQQADISSECNSTATGGVAKKVRVQSSSTAPLKVRKEKLGDRITALHRLVSPFGKTDTASVLLEAIGCIRFLQAQIQALSAPYLGNATASSKATHHPECNKRDAAEDLRSKGLCLVPISCTQLVASDNGADYWAPSLGGGFFT